MYVVRPSDVSHRLFLDCTQPLRFEKRGIQNSSQPSRSIRNSEGHPEWKPSRTTATLNAVSIAFTQHFLIGVHQYDQ